MGTIINHTKQSFILLFTILWTICWSYDLFSSSLLHQLYNAPFFDIEIDRTFWAIFALGIPQFIISNKWCCLLLDGLVLILPFILCFKPNKIIISLIWLTVILIHTITVQAYTSNHSKLDVSIFLFAIAFCFNKQSFTLSIKAIRFYLLFVFCSAAMYKLFNGALIDKTLLTNILSYQNLEQLLYVPNHITSKVTDLLLNHPTIAYLNYWCLFLLQCAFFMGWFTYKYDKFLLFLFVLFIVLTFVVMGILNPKALTLGLPFLWYSLHHKVH